MEKGNDIRKGWCLPQAVGRALWSPWDLFRGFKDLEFKDLDHLGFHTPVRRYAGAADIQCATRVKPPLCQELRIGSVNCKSFVVIFSKLEHAI